RRSGSPGVVTASHPGRLSSPSLTPFSPRCRTRGWRVVGGTSAPPDGASARAAGQRTMSSPCWRGADLMALLGEVSAPVSDAHDVRIVFGACEPHLLSFYGLHQRPFGTRHINSPEAGLLIPMVSFSAAPEALLEFGTGGH